MLGNLTSLVGLAAASLGMSFGNDSSSTYRPSTDKVEFIHPPKAPLTKRQRRRLKGRKS